MNRPEQLPKPICWHEGMLLSPQHFQQNHIYWENQLQELSVNLAQYRWGIFEMTFDEGRLLEGQVDITRLRAIMPDGLVIDYDAKHDKPLQLPLDEVETLATTGKVKIHLTVPIRVPGSASDSTDIQRFKVCDGKPVKDDKTDKNLKSTDRRQFVKKLAYVTPVILTLSVRADARTNPGSP